MNSKLTLITILFPLLYPVMDHNYKYKSMRLNLNSDSIIGGVDNHENDDESDHGDGSGNNSEWQCGLNYHGLSGNNRSPSSYFFKKIRNSSGYVDYDLYIDNNYRVNMRGNTGGYYTDYIIVQVGGVIEYMVYGYVLDNSMMDKVFAFNFHDFNMAYEYKVDDMVVDTSNDSRIRLRYSICKRDTEYNQDGFPYNG